MVQHPTEVDLVGHVMVQSIKVKWIVKDQKEGLLEDQVSVEVVLEGRVLVEKNMKSQILIGEALWMVQDPIEVDLEELILVEVGDIELVL